MSNLPPFVPVPSDRAIMFVIVGTLVGLVVAIVLVSTGVF